MCFSVFHISLFLNCWYTYSIFNVSVGIFLTHGVVNVVQLFSLRTSLFSSEPSKCVYLGSARFDSRPRAVFLWKLSERTTRSNFQLARLCAFISSHLKFAFRFIYFSAVLEFYNKFYLQPYLFFNFQSDD